MKFYDVYNGDADGLCALLQLRLAEPREAVLVSGVKRDIRLLDRVDAQHADEIVVLDVSLDANRNALERALESGARVSWFDHHYPGDIPLHPAFVSHIDTDPRICSSLIVDRHLKGRFSHWAIVAAFGDNLTTSFTPGGITITAVPEPTSLALLSTALLAFIARTRHRRRTALVKCQTSRVI